MSKFESHGSISRRRLLDNTLALGAGLAALKVAPVFAEDVWKVAWAEVGPVGDAGWTY